MAPVFDINAKADVLQVYLDQFKDSANVPGGLYVALSNGLKRLRESETAPKANGLESEKY